MISRDKVISTALLKLGEVSVYNDNRSREYNIANTLLENVINNIAVRNDFLFNSVTIKLTSDGKNEDTDEYRFNVPVDFLNKISFINDPSARIESEFIYSTSEEVILQYCRKIDFNEFPDYLFNYMTYALALEISETYSTYADRVNLLNTRLEQERQNIYRIGYIPKQREV